ncbi:acyl-CoA synthetase [Thioflexithrix psekupsensis]|uniref:Acyl-CoA synthetase n=1 Tax=Thioflexithrix psekupsensis TaxID=1570016 RepID=A0A251X619_9GAMM|nr:acyl-CoA synthetase [Thioflexithrix psekupsensis]OUD12377.1 acyl-CoA synthetase [Thioflexithrix psekupsensis]
MSNPYLTGLDKNNANYVPLSPLSFLERAAYIYPQEWALIYGQLRYSWQDTYRRIKRFASALQRRGIGKGDTVAIMSPNIPAMYEAHFAIPMIGAVLNSLNTRLDAKMIAFMLDHSEAKVLITDTEFFPIIESALKLLSRPILVIDIIDEQASYQNDILGEINYEAFLEEGDPDFAWQLPEDEWQAMTLNYTSGTTGNPKGVVYHHRGAYLNAISNMMDWELPKHTVYLWTLPMFHCNGWCFPWTMAAAVGTNVCLRKIDPILIYDIIVQEKVTHFCGAPIVHNLLLNAPESVRAKKTHMVHGFIAGAAPPAAILEAMERNGFKITHVYGLTETYGPSVICDWHREWDTLDSTTRSRLNARQGVRNHVLEGLMVADPHTLEPVNPDGQMMGEIFMRGNNVMMGYLKNPRATEQAFMGGWFHSGDLAVMHEDGYVEIKDRSKDIIISGGENISTIEVEDVLYRHPAVLEAAVVAKPDEKWGETPCAFVTLKEGQSVTEEELIDFCRQQMAHFKIPRHIVFSHLPKTSTGKIQKFLLREQAKKAE